MKIPLTDKFLWDLYNAAEKISDILEAPEVFRLRSFSDICDTGKYKYWKLYRRKQNKKQFAQFIYYLKKRGYIKIKNLKKEKAILLTHKGQEKALRAKFKIEPAKKRKDKKWIMAVYDIPENQHKQRDNLRAFLRSLGFKQFQQSIWICPNDVYGDLERVIRTYSLDEFVRIFLIEEIQI